jgi:NAD dependent epimerase/dehydratase family enzyme
MSWISLDDEIGAILHLLGSNDSGPVDLTAPEPVRNRDFVATLARVLGRPAFVPVPRLGPALLLGHDRADNLLFTGQRVQPAVLLASGYRFRFPALDGALRHLLGKT